MKGSTISDKELETWASIKRADEAHEYDWNRHGWGAPVVVTTLAPEVLEMRRILRDFIGRHADTTQDPLVLRAVELLGFNLEPSQPMFPKWPQPDRNGVVWSPTEPPRRVRWPEPRLEQAWQEYKRAWAKSIAPTATPRDIDPDAKRRALRAFNAGWRACLKGTTCAQAQVPECTQVPVPAQGEGST